VTFNGGETFTELDTPTSQFYHVSVDNEFRIIFMVSRDNSSIRIASRSSGSIGPESWYAAAGGEVDISKPTQRMLTYNMNTMAN
jgi:hypothetical protein